MNITDVRVRKIAKEGKMKAVVSITLDNVFVVHDIKSNRRRKGNVYRDAEQESIRWRISRHCPSDQLRDKRSYAESYS